jgi:hypothetical protein
MASHAITILFMLIDTENFLLSLYSSYYLASEL